MKHWNPAELHEFLGSAVPGVALAASAPGLNGTQINPADLPGPLAEVLAHPDEDRSGTIWRLAMGCAWHRLPVEELRRAVESDDWLRSKLDGRHDDYLDSQYRKALDRVRDQYFDPRELVPGGERPSNATSSPEMVSDGELGPWRPVDLIGIVEGLQDGTLARPAPTVGLRDDGAALFYRRSVNALYGTSGCGKTITALTACAQEVADGHHVVFIDFEADAAVIVGRLLDLRVDPDAVTTLFHYLNPDVRLDSQAELLQLIRELDPSLVIIDSTGESMALEGDRPNDDDDTVRWFNRMAKPISRLGPAVVVIDHMTKADESALYASGSHRKRGAITGASYTQVTVEEFAKGKAGCAKLLCSKDRHGTYARGQRVATLQVFPGDGAALHVVLAAPADDGDGSTRRLTSIMEKISRDVLETGGPTSLRGVLDAVRGSRKEGVISALRTLVAEGYVTETPGARGAKMHTSARPYRQADDPRSDRYFGRGTDGIL